MRERKGVLFARVVHDLTTKSAPSLDLDKLGLIFRLFERGLGDVAYGFKFVGGTRFLSFIYTCTKVITIRWFGREVDYFDDQNRLTSSHSSIQFKIS